MAGAALFVALLCTPLSGCSGEAPLDETATSLERSVQDAGGEVFERTSGRSTEGAASSSPNIRLDVRFERGDEALVDELEADDWVLEDVEASPGRRRHVLRRDGRVLGVNGEGRDDENRLTLIVE